MPARLTTDQPRAKSTLDRALSLFADVRPGEGATVLLMLANIFLLLICYSVIKTVREPLILLGGGAEVRSYAAAGQATLLMVLVPLYAWFAGRVNRARLLVGVTLFFIACIELFAAAVTARMPYVGVAFFIWVGIFNMSLVAQFWSFANDIYRKEDGERLFPVILIGMTAGAPIGSFVAARLFHSGIAPQVILQISALLLAVSVGLYLAINRRETVRTPNADAALGQGGGFRLVLESRYLRLIAFLVVLLNIVNTTGEYLVARLLTLHVKELALMTPGFDKQAYIGTFSGDYQFWVNVVALLLQAFATSRLVKYRGLAGALMALPLIALGGYAIIAAGVGFSVVRWIKTAENATDYSIMNTARQLLWLPTTREEKYKAKQAIDTFFVRGGDVLSAGVVYLGTHIMHLTIQQFATVNVALTVVWIGVALRLLKPAAKPAARISFRPIVAGAAAALLVLVASGRASAQETRQAQLDAMKAQKSTDLHPYEPDSLERRLEMVDRAMNSNRPFYVVMGGSLDGGGVAAGPGYRARYGDTGRFDAHATWSVRNYREAGAALQFPKFGNDRITLTARGSWLNAPSVTTYGVGPDTTKADRNTYAYRSSTAGMSARVQATKHVAVGGAVDAMRFDALPTSINDVIDTVKPTYARTSAFAEFDSRTGPGYSRNGGLYRVELSNYDQMNGGAESFRRLDAEVQRFVPLMRENWVLAFRALASTTDMSGDNVVPYFLMPDLGGTHTLRGFSTWRFRDRNRMAFSGEYRWTAGPLIDMALFVDAGKVAPRLSELDFSHLEISKGIGFRVHTPGATVTRIEVARSREGTSLIFAFSPSF